MLHMCVHSSFGVLVVRQVNVQVNDNSDTSSDDEGDDNGSDNDASSAASHNDNSRGNMSASEDEDTQANNKLHPSVTDQPPETRSSNVLTVTPIKIKCHPKRIRTMERILHLKHNRRRGRPPLTQNVSFERHSFSSLSRTLLPVATSAVAKIRRMRGRPKGSKNKVKRWPWIGAKQSHKNKQNNFQLTTDAVGSFPSTEWPQTTDFGRSESLEDAKSSKKSSKQIFWRPPTDADSRSVLDQISITDVTANALTVTVRESATQDGFFSS